MNHLFTLPLGQPDLKQDPILINKYLDALSEALFSDQLSFEPGHLFQGYKFDVAKIQPGYTNIHAIWSGELRNEGSNMIRITMDPAVNIDLEAKWMRELPIPKYAVYGPVQITGPLPSRVKSGDFIGVLPNAAQFQIFFQDENGYYLDPRYYFQRFKEEKNWNLPAGAPIPLIKGLNDIRLRIVRPPRAGESPPFIFIEGGSKDSVFINPPAEVNPIYFSFLSNDLIKVGFKGGSPGSANCMVKDVSDEMYRTRNASKSFSPSGQLPWVIDIENFLKPFHLPYLPSNGKTRPGQPLAYEISITTTETSLVKISQDIKDIIRQEYRFHSTPFQADSVSLPIPARKKIEFNNFKSKNFTAQEIQKSNYNDAKNNWMLNAKETLQVADYIQEKYAEELKDRRLKYPEEYIKVTSPKLVINSTWRNPERNESKSGARKSNHQSGKAIDMKSLHRGNNNNNPDNIGMFVSLMEAGRAFLEDVILLNGASNSAKVEVFLENNSALYWKIYVDPNTGDIISKKGSAFNWADPASPEEGIKVAARYATHLHIGWPGLSPSDELILPSSASNVTPQKSVSLQNIIFIATEDSGVPADKQIAINYAAESVAQSLTEDDPSIPTRIIEVSNAIQFLTHLNAFREPEYQIKYFFTFSHAWSAGLSLKNYPSGTKAEELIDENFLKEINALYGIPPVETPGEESDKENAENGVLKFGPDDYTEIMPHQIRISNLTYLSKIHKDRLRYTFKRSEGVFLVGCNTANEDIAPKSNFCDSFAKLLQRPAYGAAYPAFFFVRNERTGKWMDEVITRQTKPQDLPGVPILLVPGKYGRGSLFAYMLKFKSLPPRIPEIPLTPHLLNIYKRMLKKCNP